MKIKAFYLIVLALLVLITYLIFNLENFSKFQKVKVIKIGSGTENAMFYPVASALCEIFNKYNQDKNVICEAVLSKGSDYNLKAVENDEFDMGISQANLQYDAYNGLNKFSKNPYKNLRTLFGLHTEYMTIITKKDSAIKSFSDLRKKKVNIGNIGSGNIILFYQMIDKIGWKEDDFKEIYKESGSDIKKVLCDSDKVDAAIYMVGHPNKSFSTMLENCNTKLINLSDAEIKDFIAISPNKFYKSSVPQNTYPQLHQEIKTFSSKTILSASAKLDKKIVNNFVHIIFKHKEELIKLQPSLSAMTFFVKDDNNLAPLHEGIKK